MNNVWNILQFVSVLGTGYVGFLQANHIKTAINHPIIRPHKDRLPLREDYFFNETNFCRLTGSIIGGIIGYHCWPATLLVSLPFVEEAWRGRGGGGRGRGNEGNGGNIELNNVGGNANSNLSIVRRFTGWF